MPMSFTRRTAIFWSLVLAIYVTGYLTIRGTSVRTLEKDGRETIVFPEWPRSLYPIYRPMTCIDGKITGTHFRQDPHPE